MQNTGTKYKSALFGGSFNPIHIGHLALIHDAYEFINLERVIIVPALLSNFKRGSKPIEYERRIDMIALAIEDYRELYPSDNIEIVISEVEKERGGISYTSETIKYFFAELSESGKVNFIMGDDLLTNLELWHDFPYLKDHVRFFCFNRDGKRREVEGCEIYFFNNEKVVSSSTDIRSGDLENLSRRVREYAAINELF